jgi:hypothetical protein
MVCPDKIPVLTLQCQLPDPTSVTNIYHIKIQTQWPKVKVQMDKQRSTKHTYKTEDRVARTQLKTEENSCAPEGFT